MSYRTDTNATYDRTLLSNVPDPTRAEKQEGYNVDLLDDGRDRGGPTPPDGLPSVQRPLAPADGYSPGAVAIARKQGQLEKGGEAAALRKMPWYRTRWGVTAIVIAIVLIIGAAVGGAVGGSQHHSHNNSANNTGGGSGNNTNPGTGSDNNSTTGGGGGGGGGNGGSLQGATATATTTPSLTGSSNTFLPQTSTQTSTATSTETTAAGPAVASVGPSGTAEPGSPPARTQV